MYHGAAGIDVEPMDPGWRFAVVLRGAKRPYSESRAGAGTSRACGVSSRRRLETPDAGVGAVMQGWLSHLAVTRRPRRLRGGKWEKE
jgi:hypothetical protein